MIPEEFLDAIAVRELETWFLSQGFQLAGGWDADDPNCARNYGPHRVIVVSAYADQPVEVQALSLNLVHYIYERNQLPGAVKFHYYDLGTYQQPDGGTFVYASIYHQ